jgi:hypothetical protein
MGDKDKGLEMGSIKKKVTMVNLPHMGDVARIQT